MRSKNMFSWGGVEGWGEKAYNCNWITIKIKKKRICCIQPLGLHSWSQLRSFWHCCIGGPPSKNGFLFKSSTSDSLWQTGLKTDRKGGSGKHVSSIKREWGWYWFDRPLGLWYTPFRGKVRRKVRRSAPIIPLSIVGINLRGKKKAMAPSPAAG